LQLVTEGARNCAPLVDQLTPFDRTELSYFTLNYYMAGFEVANTNNINHLVSDRSILSPVCYQKLLSPDKPICINSLQSLIRGFNERHQRDHLYDIHILIKHPKCKSFINDHVLNDDFRIYHGSTVSKYKEDALKFEQYQRDTFKQISELAPTFIEIDAYPENPRIKSEVLNLVTGLVDTKF